MAPRLRRTATKPAGRESIMLDLSHQSFTSKFNLNISYFFFHSKGGPRFDAFRSDTRFQGLLRRIETFRSSPRLRDFLGYLVKRQAMEGQDKETLIGMEFFQRDPAYDPRKDPIVRLET